MDAVSIFWFRRDLRLNDNMGLHKALQSGNPVLPIFIFDKFILDKLENPLDRRVSFIYETIQSLKNQLKSFNSDLFVYYGTPQEAFTELLSRYQVQAVYANDDYEPYAKERDGHLSTLLAELGIPLHLSKDHVVFEKSEVVKDDGNPYTLFTPYSKKWKAKLAVAPVCSVNSEDLRDHFYSFSSDNLLSLEAMGFKKVNYKWPSTELPDAIIENYANNRDFPSVPGTSRLGLHLRFGTISIRALVLKALRFNEKYLNELIWRDFYQQILWHFPNVVDKSFKPKYDDIQWRNNEAEFKAWCDGLTGYPIVDAGMRELNETGYMHNRVRMIVASFLTKHLLIDWRWGEAYFARHLLDFDLASNNGGWQWAAGSGVDAAPYFRVFNPHLQTEKFDPQRLYIKKWVAEVDELYYPRPIVIHEVARARCLETYKAALG